MPRRSFKDDRHISITFIVRSAARTAAEQNGLFRGIGVCYPSSKGAGYFQRAGSDVCKGNAMAEGENS